MRKRRISRAVAPALLAVAALSQLACPPYGKKPAADVGKIELTLFETFKDAYADPRVDGLFYEVTDPQTVAEVERLYDQKQPADKALDFKKHNLIRLTAADGSITELDLAPAEPGAHDYLTSVRQGNEWFTIDPALRDTLTRLLRETEVFLDSQLAAP